MRISMIAAIGEGNRVLGKDNKLIWHIPEDTKFFRDTTRGHVVIMGRKTYASMGKPLPQRVNIVITRDENWQAEGIIICHNLKDALVIARSEATKRRFGEASTLGVQSTSEQKIAADSASPRNDRDDEIFIIGGGQIYTEGLPFADRLYLTIVHGNFDGDAFFPEYSEFTKVIEKRESEGNGYKYTFLTLER